MLEYISAFLSLNFFLNSSSTFIQSARVTFAIIQPLGYSKFRCSNFFIAFLSTPLPAWIRISPLYFVFQVLNSYSFSPAAINEAKGCFIVIAFIYTSVYANPRLCKRKSYANPRSLCFKMAASFKACRYSSTGDNGTFFSQFS